MTPDIRLRKRKDGGEKDRAKNDLHCAIFVKSNVDVEIKYSRM